MRPAVGVAALLALSACPGPDRELARAVREYDDALVRAFATSDPFQVAAIAAPKEADRVRILIDLKSNARLVLESTLESFEVTSARRSGDTGTVETRERWRYRDRSLQPGAPVGPEIASEMTMRYALAREGGRWKVTSATTLSNVYLELPGELPGGAARPPIPK